MAKKKLTDQLKRFDRQVNNQSIKKQPRLPNRYQKLADKTGGEIVSNHCGSFCMVKKLYPFGYRHGAFELKRDQPLLPLSAFSTDDNDVKLDQYSLLYFDTETTGLGGAGAVAFLAGFGSLNKAGFEIRQYLLVDYDDESSALEAMLEEFSDSKTLVTYNGATFDLPLIKTRMIINRTARKIPLAHHIDLLHATRRLFKRRIGECNLINAEAKLMNFYRKDDIPGFLVPSVYFEWLNSESTDLLENVMEHNRLDIISLYFLGNHIAHLYQTSGEESVEVDDLHSLSKLFGRRRDHQSVEQIYNRIDQLEPNQAEDLILYHAFNFKRQKKHEKATQLFTLLSESSSREGYWANLELAKHYEHRQKEIPTALKHSQSAQNICPYGKTTQLQLKKRITRLQLKLKKQKK